MTLKVKKTENVAAVDPGEYLSVITEVEEGFHPEYKENYTWKIKIKDATLDGESVDDGAGGLVELRFFTSQSWTNNEKNKLNQLLLAVGQDHEIGDELNLEECVGKKFRAIVTDKVTEKGTYSRVSGFLPLKKTKKVEVKKEEKPVEKKAEKKEEKLSSADDGLFDFDAD